MHVPVVPGGAHPVVEAVDRRGHAYASLLRGSVSLLLTQPITWAVTLVTAIFIPRLLGDERLGEMYIALAVSAIAGEVAALGIPDVLTRRIAARPRDVNVEASIALVLVAAVAVALGGAVALAAPMLAIGVHRVLLGVAIVGMVFALAQRVFLSVLIGTERFGRFAWFNALSQLLQTAAGLLALVPTSDPAAYLGGRAAASLVLLALIARLARFRPELPLDAMRWRDLIRAGVPFLGWNVAARIRIESDRIILAVLAGAAGVGWYGAASQIVLIPIFIPTLVATPLLPVLTRTAHDLPLFRETLRRSIVAVLVLTAPCAGLIFALAPAIPAALGWPDPFTRSIPVMMLLALLQPIMAVDIVLAAGLIALHREHRWVRVGIVAALANPVLNLALIPTLSVIAGNGAVGAAMAAVITELFMCVCALALSPRQAVDRAALGTALRIAIATALLVAVASALSHVSLVAAVVAGTAVYLASALALGAIGITDVRALQRFAVRAIAARSIA